MELRSTLANNSQVDYVINKMKKHSKTAALDVIAAYNLFSDINSELNDKALKRLERVYIMCKYMDPEAEDIISMLLFNDALNNKATLRIFLQNFSEKRYEDYYNHMREACKNSPKKDDLSREDCISYYIMIRVCDKMFHNLIRKTSKNRAPSTVTISKAYYLAKEAHNWTYRDSGEPYITHPIRVASILADIGVESSILAAALLHDVVEKTNCTLDAVSNECGVKIAQYVDVFTSVDKEYAESHHSSEYQCDKAEPDQRRFDKLVRTVASSDNDMIFALYIKAAEIIDNLSNINFESDNSIQNTNYEMELDYLPLFRAFNLNYFVKEIENLAWRASDIERYAKMQEKYDDMFCRNSVSIEEYKNVLRFYTESGVNSYAQLLGNAGYYIEIQERHLLPYEVFNHINKAGGSITNLSKRIDKRFVPVCDIDIIADPKDTAANLDALITGFVKTFEEKIAKTGRTIIDFNKTENAFVFLVEDYYRNVFRCRLILRNDYEIHKKGIYVRDVIETIEEESGERVEKINIKLRNGKMKSIQKGATVIDLAFAIHTQIGLTVKSAIINGHKDNIYRILQEGDFVVIEADSDISSPIPHVRISWLKSVVTKKARKNIIEYLSDKYEGDDPRYESIAQTSVVETVSDKILELLRS